MKKDSYGMGILMGIIVPVLLFGVLIGVLWILVHAKPEMLHNNPSLYKILIPKFMLISMIPSVFIMRHYLLKLQYDKTGRGILLATFALGILFIILHFTL